jgi:hypothetical protein
MDKLTPRQLRQAGYDNWNANPYMTPEQLEETGYSTPESLETDIVATLGRQAISPASLSPNNPKAPPVPQAAPRRAIDRRRLSHRGKIIADDPTTEHMREEQRKHLP